MLYFYLGGQMVWRFSIVSTFLWNNSFIELKITKYFGVHKDPPTYIYDEKTTEWDVLLFFGSLARTVRAGCPANTTGEAWPLSGRIGRSRSAYTNTAALIGWAGCVPVLVDGDWLEGTRCQRAPENKLERGAEIYLGRRTVYISRTVISGS